MTTKKFRFESAHRLIGGYKGKCRNLHGHSWNGHIGVITPDELDEFSMSVDFGVLGILTKEIEDRYDHKTIISSRDTDLRNFLLSENNAIVVTPGNPTCEIIAALILDDAIEFFKKQTTGRPVIVHHVTIEETCTTSFTLLAEEFRDSYSFSREKENEIEVRLTRNIMADVRLYIKEFFKS